MLFIVASGVSARQPPRWTRAGVDRQSRTTAVSPDLPSSGVRHSGYGHESSAAGIQEFVNEKMKHVSSLDAAA
jgi:acyl-CoA reductase-like NAD-dependent aldehyde dehydrogenase